GSGKTRVLTSRIAYMLEQGVKPWNILALTFTNKAASQMRERIEQMVEGSASRYIRMGTFHSVFSRILRENAERIGYTQSFTIYEPNDCKNLLKTICKELGLADDKYKPQRILSRISYAKNALITPGAYIANASFAAEDRQAQIPRFGEVYEAYCRRCKHNGAMDFDDLLLQTNILLRDCPDVLEKYQEQFQYILVDEYQDTNYAQYIIIRRLSLKHSRVCVVGDDAQSIYSFRGAKIENILSFQKDYPQAKVFKLEQNYRSTQTIVNAANSVIERNSRRMKKVCFSEGDSGEKIRIVRSYTDREEGDIIAQDIREKLNGSEDSWNEVVVLYRTNNQSAVVEQSLRRHSIPYRIYKGSSFYDHKEIKDVMAYIRLVINPKDDEAFKRVVNYPARGIGDTTVSRIEELARSRNQSMWEAVDALVAEAATLGDPMQKTIARKVTEFVNLIRELAQARESKSLYDFGLELASRSGILQIYRQENTPESQSAIDNIEELLNSMQLFREQREAEIRNGEREESEQPTIEEWLQSVMLMTDMDNDDEGADDRVTLMTVHSAKGLEYKYVYIAGCEENLFPSQRALESVDGVEEERRLFYVALTRAKSEAMITYCDMRYKWGNMEFSSPSRFLSEIDPKYVECDEDLSPKSGASSQGSLTGRMGNFSQASATERRNGQTAVEALRQRFDYRFQQKRAEAGAQAARGGVKSGVKVAPDPKIVAPIQQPRSVEGMRRITPSVAGAGAVTSCPYQIGDRVEHPKFGVGVIQRIEPLATDHKVVVDFGSYGEKTLLAKFAKLEKL
ncbi:MAG: UvrD-helicase domain-containing protein, partial [Alistipes sp.]|nr:UvrD-helicase domain-containing protein [Alistipes sp.]